MYEEVPRVPDFPALERRALAFWRERDVPGKLRAKNRGAASWSFQDGPITANNPMGVHHAWGRSLKDIFQRYHAMNGRDLRWQNGFDCQGLWVEVEVEKERGFQTKSDIAAHGIDRFVRDCKARVLTFSAKQTEQSIRLGYWMDWDEPDTLRALRDALLEDREEITVRMPSGQELTDRPERIIARLGDRDCGGSYFTFSDENNYTIWTFLKKCHEEGLIYRGTDVMPWCCRCGTGLSQMEVTEGRSITRHTSVFVRFPLREREREALLVWTTTPWTLTSNVAAAVNPQMTYLKVRCGEWIYYLGKGTLRSERRQDLEAAGRRESHRLETLESVLGRSGEVEVLEELAGAELLGLCYEGPFDHLPAQERPGGCGGEESEASAGANAIDCHRVIAWEEVSEQEGTGIVHIAPGCGAEDHLLGQELGLVAVAPLGEGGEYLEGFGSLTGRHVLELTDEIVQDLAQRGVLVAKESYPHVYPHCWRCKQELVFRLVDEWFIRMDWRDRIKELVPQIRWIPPDGAARELDWLNNMGDWMISKKRFWGLALPIWCCQECGKFDVLGGREELRERAVAGWEEFEGHTPHRPWVDLVELACTCGGRMKRVEDVGNPWLDAGIVPFSTNHYGTDRAHWERWFPADFVVECFPGQFRNWFYALLAMSAMLSRRPPFRVLLGHALVRDARGEDMHKSKGNAIAFDEAAEVFGAEVMRYLYASQNPIHNLAFPDLPAAGSQRTGKSGIDGEVRARLLTLWNCYSFFVTYAGIDGWRGGAAPALPVGERSELDRWVLSRLQRLIQSAHQAFADFTIYRFVDRLEHFTDELSTWYLRRSRRRFWRSGSDQDKEAAYQTLYGVLTTMTRLLAPILPFLCEEMYANLVRGVDPDAPESVHLTDYPQADPELIDPGLERGIDCVIRAKNQALKLRSLARNKVRQPLGRLLVRPRDDADRAVLADAHFAGQLLEECNVKRLELIEDEARIATLEVKPRFDVLGPRYGKRVKAIAKHLGELEAAGLRQSLREGPVELEVEGERVEISADDLTFDLRGPDQLEVAEEQGTFMALDTALTPALEAEGIARDFNRQAQERRKSTGLQVSDRIELEFSASDRVAEAVGAHEEWLRGELLAGEIRRVGELSESAPAKVSGEKVFLRVRKAP